MRLAPTVIAVHRRPAIFVKKLPAFSTRKHSLRIDSIYAYTPQSNPNFRNNPFGSRLQNRNFNF